ncbi:MAG: hypothetical protein OMOMHJEC_00377 [Xanthomonadales bacterium]|nr:hypothetical protein [Xanthomonadales bacterium]
MKSVLDQGVVKGTKDEMPRQRGLAGRRHAEIVRDARAGRAETHEEGVGSVEAGRRDEPKRDGLARDIRFHAVANRTMPADGADLKRPVKAHGRPGCDGPEAIVGLGQRVQQRAEDGGRHGKLSVMDVVDAHVVPERNLTPH